MRALLAFAGSRGDAQPGVLLGRELARRGHEVTVAVSPNLVEFAARHGVSAVPFGLDSGELLRAQRDDERFRGLNPVRRVQAVLDLQRRGFGTAAGDLLALAGDLGLARDKGVLVTGMACEEVAAEVARHHAIPLAALHFFPIRPNRVVPVVPAGLASRLPGELHRLGWHALTKARAWALASEITAFRRANGSGPHDTDVPLVSYTAVQAYDPDLFPGLVDELRDEPFTGFPVPAAGGELDPELAAWLTEGPAPVYAGFGSMPVADPIATESMAREVCRRLGRRLLLVGPMFRPRIGLDLAVVDQVDHGAVLPLCTAAVHHGGAGTTAAALRAGVPSVICSVQADQPYWGRQLEQLGLGVTVPFAGLTANRLERSLIRATAPEVVAWAAAYGAGFRDDGVARAADVIESFSATGESANRESIAPDTGVRELPSTIGGVR
ncbi:nucleotide disphospho-sugar-binding domain-containing protein [Nocardia sp. CDC153]|uniref:glycosyltransferase n=1 Tax=Nocardia sp. CDC153 TaxID=3112167 RepID=UPI002DB942BB|nr:nucleotide disphospho-sugar-binding domain-containing protein [Nocardia sp. CDC153]MEC3956781.1 nucleotide disphospho-sugar-binding domain-containing protein [Nocardia sp. CDC153]